MKFSETLNKIRNKSPLVHNITNYVVMNTTANALLSIGASPVMAHSKNEVEDIVSISSSLVLNMGTLSEKWVESMILAGIKGKSLNIPIVFDPVGIGASKYRTETALKIINEVNPNVIRGNASEILALSNSSLKTKGVDSTADSSDALDSAINLSKKYGNTIIVSGKVDFIVTNDVISKVNNGCHLMANVTGMGCTSTSIVGACIAVEKDTHLAATSAMIFMGISGEISEEISNGPGSFQSNFLDSLYQIDSNKIQSRIKIDE